MSDVLLEFAGVTRVYGEGEARVAALDGVDLAIRTGEFVSLMGPSGSGKSTSLNILGCLDRPTAGTYRVQDVDAGALDEDRRALLRRYTIGFVFQGFNLLPRASAVENVMLPLVYLRVPRAERRARALAALADVGLSGRAGHTPAQLSGGQQQRVAIARALVTQPSVVLADEPTGNLDHRTSHEIMRLLVDLNATRGITIVMVTHEADIGAYGHRTIRFRDGRIVDEAVA